MLNCLSKKETHRINSLYFDKDKSVCTQCFFHVISHGAFNLVFSLCLEK